MGDFATLGGGAQKSNGNPTDELEWEFTVFSLHEAQFQDPDRRCNEREEKLMKILSLSVERCLGGLREMDLERKAWVNSSSGHQKEIMISQGTSSEANMSP